MCNDATHSNTLSCSATRFTHHLLCPLVSLPCTCCQLSIRSLSSASLLPPVALAFLTLPHTMQILNRSYLRPVSNPFPRPKIILFPFPSFRRDLPVRGTERVASNTKRSLTRQPLVYLPCTPSSSLTHTQSFIPPLPAPNIDG